jgi:hypothetical protein
LVKYTVIKTRAHIEGKVYLRGEEIELVDSALANHLLDQKVVVPAIDTRLPTESDGLFEDLKKENEKLKKANADQKAIIARLTADIQTKSNEISNLQAKKK